jgi:hypothetical protein
MTLGCRSFSVGSHSFHTISCFSDPCFRPLGGSQYRMEWMVPWSLV